MTTAEASIQPPFYDELFASFAGLAALRGVITHGPLDTVYEAGRDGTRTPEGAVVDGFDYHINASALPQAIRDIGIDRLYIGSYASTVVGDTVWDEQVWIYIHDHIGLNTYATFTKARLTGTIDLMTDIEADPSPHIVTETNLSNAEKLDIVARIFCGDRALLDLDGPTGAFARSTLLRLTESHEPNISDIELLRFIASKLET
jgi:hypothetical protein